MPPIGYPGNSISKAARAKDGGGFESAIEVALGLVAESNFQHMTRVNATVSSIPARNYAATRLADLGDSVYEAGQENTYNSNLTDGQTLNRTDAERVWDKPSIGDGAVAYAKSRAYRHDRSGGHYWTDFYSPESFVGWPTATGGTTPEATAGFLDAWFSWYMKTVFDPRFMHAWNFTGDGSLLQSGDGESFGEDATVNGDTVKLIGIDPTGAWVVFYTPNVSDLRLGDAGQTLTGVTSGASVTLDADTANYRHDGTGLDKIARFWLSDGSVDPDPKVSLRLKNAVITNVTGTGGFFTDGVDPTAWTRVDAVYKASTGKFYVLLNMQVVDEITPDDVGFDFNQNESFHPALIGMDSQRAIGQATDFGEIVFENDIAKVVATDNSDFSLSTVFEDCPVTAWSSAEGTFSFMVNRGAMSDQDTVHFHLIEDIAATSLTTDYLGASQ